MEFFNLSRVKFVILLMTVMLFNACTLVEPFVDRRRNAGAKTEAQLYVGKSKTDEPAICYNMLTTNYQTIKKMADTECQNNKTGKYAEPVKQTVFTCRIFIPNHFYFKCVK
jgi:hypothetical protein